MEMPSDLKAFIRIKNHIGIETRVLYRRTNQVNRRTRLQLLLHPSFRTKVIAGCHNQVGHLGQDRVLELLRDQL